jgi:exportin-7
MNYLAARGPKLQNFVIVSLIQLVCRITKFGWFDDDRFKEIFKEATDFLTLVSMPYVLYGSYLIAYHIDRNIK